MINIILTFKRLTSEISSDKRILCCHLPTHLVRKICKVNLKSMGRDVAAVILEENMESKMFATS